MNTNTQFQSLGNAFSSSLMGSYSLAGNVSPEKFNSMGEKFIELIKDGKDFRQVFRDANLEKDCYEDVLLAAQIGVGWLQVVKEEVGDRKINVNLRSLTGMFTKLMFNKSHVDLLNQRVVALATDPVMQEKSTALGIEFQKGASWQCCFNKAIDLIFEGLPEELEYVSNFCKNNCYGMIHLLETFFDIAIYIDEQKKAQAVDNVSSSTETDQFETASAVASGPESDREKEDFFDWSRYYANVSS